MGKHETRSDKTCQNCGYFVDKNYCPKCGQENTDSRHSFYHLFTHFVSDFFHYDSSFWKTTRTLFKSPGKLSLAYMNGKRKSQVNPFSFYIFISFLTFFIPHILSYPEEKTEQIEIQTEPLNAIAALDSIKILDNEIAYKSNDSISHTTSQRRSSIEEAMVSIIKKIPDKERKEKALEFFINNLPKVLFIYMPIFAFWMWLFHNKKKRYYFDSGIFTLHFFSVVLLSITLCIVLDWACEWLKLDALRFIFWLILFFYITFYFFRGNRVFYDENRFLSNTKAMVLMAINTFCILTVLLAYGIFILYKIYYK